MNSYQKIAIGIAIILIVIVVSIVVIIILKKKNKNKEIVTFPELLEAFGGKSNITSVSQKGSRISVEVDNKKVIDKDKIKQQGVDTIVVSNKKVTMVVGNKMAVLMYNYLNEQSEI